MAPTQLEAQARLKLVEAASVLAEAVAQLKASVAEHLAAEGWEAAERDLGLAKRLGQQRATILALVAAWPSPAEAPAEPPTLDEGAQALDAPRHQAQSRDAADEGAKDNAPNEREDGDEEDDGEAEEEGQPDPLKRRRNPNTTLRIAFAQGPTLTHRVAKDAFTQALGHLGIEKVAALGLRVNGIPLVSEELDPLYAEKQLSHEAVQGHVVCTHSNTRKKKELLDDICARLGVVCEVAIVPRPAAPQDAPEEALGGAWASEPTGLPDAAPGAVPDGVPTPGALGGPSAERQGNTSDAPTPPPPAEAPDGPLPECPTASQENDEKTSTEPKASPQLVALKRDAKAALALAEARMQALQAGFQLSEPSGWGEARTRVRTQNATISAVLNGHWQDALAAADEWWHEARQQAQSKGPTWRGSPFSWRTEANDLVPGHYRPEENAKIPPALRPWGLGLWSAMGCPATWNDSIPDWATHWVEAATALTQARAQAALWSRRAQRYAPGATAAPTAGAEAPALPLKLTEAIQENTMTLEAQPPQPSESLAIALAEDAAHAHAHALPPAPMAQAEAAPPSPQDSAHVQAIEATAALPASESATAFATEAPKPSVAEPECFGGLSPDEAFLKPQLVAKALQATRQRLGLGDKPWSVGELGLGPTERDWLRRWSLAVQPRVLRQHLEAGYPWCDAQGLMLWVAFTTWHRERGAEGQSWRAPQAGLNEDTAHFLFTAQGSPSRLLKQALEAGAHRHQLRHAFNDAGAQAYSATLALQAGFTRAGAKRHLGRWLSSQQQQRQAFEALLGGAHASPSFDRLWRALKRRRVQALSSVHLQQELQSNPWVPTEWAGDLEQACLANPELGAMGTGPLLEDGGGDAWHSPPCLAWPHHAAPRFTLQIPTIDHLGFDGPEVQVFLNQKHRFSFFRQEDGSYRAPNEGHLEWVPLSDQADLTLADPERRQVHSSTLHLWPGQDGMGVFALGDGQYRDPFSQNLRPGQSHAVAYRGALLQATLASGAPTWAEPSSDWQWVRMEAGQSLVLRIATGEHQGEAFWDSQAEALESASAWPPDLKLRLSSHAYDWKDLATLYVDRPAGVGIRSVQVMGQILPITPDVHEVRADFRLDDWPADLHHISPRVSIEWQGRVLTRRLQMPLHRRGLAALDAEGRWQKIGAQQSLNLNLTRQLVVHPPDREVPWREWALLEGDAFVCRPNRGSTSTELLGGYGAPLRLRRGPYNAQGQGLELCREVLDQGAVKGVTWGHDGQPVVHLSRRLELHPEHFVTLWLINGSLESHALEANPDQPMAWRVRWPVPADEVVAVVLQRGPHRLGHWASSDWSGMLETCPPGQEARLAHFLRWAKLPLASEQHEKPLKAWVAKHGPTVLATWLKSNHRNLSQKVDDVASEAWWDVMRKLVPAEAAREPNRLIEEAIEQGQNEEDVALGLLDQMSRIHPALVLAFAHSWASGEAGHPTNRVWRIQERLRKGQSEEELLASFAHEGRTSLLDRGFVTQLLQSLANHLRGRGFLRANDADNLAVALGSIDEFRRLAALEALKVMAP